LTDFLANQLTDFAQAHQGKFSPLTALRSSLYRQLVEKQGQALRVLRSLAFSPHWRCRFLAKAAPGKIAPTSVPASVS
jgi:hypothetical protein